MSLLAPRYKALGNNSRCYTCKCLVPHTGRVQVELQGWTSFRGGLDVRSKACPAGCFGGGSVTGRALGGSTGTHSYHTVEYGKEIMFHVSTLLPYSKDNQQQVRS